MHARQQGRHYRACPARAEQHGALGAASRRNPGSR